MTTGDSEVTSEGSRLIKYLRECDRQYNLALESSKQRLEDRNGARKALGEWLCPGDAKDGEKFCVWYGDSLVQCEFIQRHYADSPSCVITVRTRGRSLQ